MIFKRKVKTEFIGVGDVKDWKDAGPEIERIGQRLDAVRGTLKDIPKRGKRNKWARNHWSQIEANLLAKWRNMVMLKDTGLRQIGPNRGPVIDYNWWEKCEEIGTVFGLSLDTWIGDKLADMALQSRLEESWIKARDERLQKARQGQA